jgi:hypothetical protein
MAELDKATPSAPSARAFTKSMGTRAAGEDEDE